MERLVLRRPISTILYKTNLIYRVAADRIKESKLVSNINRILKFYMPRENGEASAKVIGAVASGLGLVTLVAGIGTKDKGAELFGIFEIIAGLAVAGTDFITERMNKNNSDSTSKYKNSRKTSSSNFLSIFASKDSSEHINPSNIDAGLEQQNLINHAIILEQGLNQLQHQSHHIDQSGNCVDHGNMHQTSHHEHHSSDLGSCNHDSGLGAGTDHHSGGFDGGNFGSHH